MTDDISSWRSSTAACASTVQILNSDIRLKSSRDIFEGRSGESDGFFRSSDGFFMGSDGFFMGSDGFLMGSEGFSRVSVECIPREWSSWRISSI